LWCTWGIRRIIYLEPKLTGLQPQMLTKGNLKYVTVFALAWIVLGSVYVNYITSSQRSDIENELKSESALLHRIVSQRADQHDAHLTSLSALAVGSEQPQRNLFLQVAGAIRQFYPRVTAVDLVPLSADKPMFTTRESSVDIYALSSAIRTAAKASTGRLVLMASPMSPGRYLIVKRSPNSELARFGLAIEIDARILLESASEFWQKPNVLISLSLADGTVLTTRQAAPDASDGNGQGRMRIAKTLGSRTQPLLLTTGYWLRPGDILFGVPTVLGLSLIGGVLLALAMIVRLLSRTRSAEMRARLGEHGARIAHASRVNALGEIASGIAHELTQPLTAILSQSQACVHLLARGEKSMESVTEILQANVAQSKRAGDILSRLRDWTKQKPAVMKLQRLNERMHNVALLLGAEAQRLSIDLSVKTDATDPTVMGDAVEIEQVIFNLVRNAMEALERDNSSERRIQMTSSVSAQHAIVEVLDNGPGIAAEMRERLFEPFITGKEKGMGLGLALCERIVERMNGRIEIGIAEGGGVSARVFLALA